MRVTKNPARRQAGDMSRVIEAELRTGKWSTCALLADHLGIDPERVRRVAKEHGLTPTGKGWAAGKKFLPID